MARDIYFKSKAVLPKDRVYWTYLNKKDFICGASAITQYFTKTLLTLNGQYSHGTNLLEMKTRTLETDKIVAAAAMPTVAPRTILGMHCYASALKCYRRKIPAAGRKYTYICLNITSGVSFSTLDNHSFYIHEKCTIL
jgi:hypothetical protein